MYTTVSSELLVTQAEELTKQVEAELKIPDPPGKLQIATEDGKDVVLSKDDDMIDPKTGWALVKNTKVWGEPTDGAERIDEDN
jgi:hypothetical protein